MTAEAFCLGSTLIYWDSVILALAALAGLAAAMAFYAGRGGRFGLCLTAPLGLILALLLSRSLYWYCHQEQFAGLASALGSFRGGGYCLIGVTAGFTLAALLTRLTGLEKDLGFLLDCLAPGLALGLALVRLSALFNNSCRGKVLITEARLMRLPFAWPTLTASGAGEYRFAAFFAEALFFALCCLALGLLFFRLYGREGRGGGRVFLVYLLLYSGAEMVIDSVRYDASFFHINGFVSVAQILSAFCVLGVLIAWTRRAVRAGRPRRRIWIAWGLWLLGLAGGGVFEYLVQRHGDWQLRCYAGMSLCVALLLGAVLSLMPRRQGVR